jgi:hypothetical protein
LAEDLLLVDRNVLVQRVEDEEMVARHILQHVVEESVERDVYFVYVIDE